MDNGVWIVKWRIATTALLLPHGAFFALGLPPVNTPDYRTYTQLLPQSQGGQARQGYIFIKLLWDSMDFEQFRTITRITEAAILNNVIYATVDKANGTGLLNSFINLHGVPVPLEYAQVSNGRGVMFQNVLLKINAVVIDADPAT